MKREAWQVRGLAPLLNGACPLSRTVLFILVGLAACAQHAPPGPPPLIVPSVGSSAPLSLPSPLVVSVLYFEDRTRMPELGWLRKGLADMLITDLSRATGLQVVQRERLDEIFREQALQAGGLVEDAAAVRIGHLSGATVILTGSVTRVGDILRVDAHLLDVERGTVLGAATVEGGVGEVLSLEKQLADRILALVRLDAGARSRPTPAASSPPSKEAAAALYEGLDAADRGDVAEALAKFEKALGKEPRYADAQGRYGRTLRAIDADVLWARAMARDGVAADRRRLAARLADDLFRQGLQAEITSVTRTEVLNGLKVGVRVRFDAQALLELRRAVGRLGGAVEEQDGRLLVRVSEEPDVHAAFAGAVTLPRRLFLHMLASDGRRLAVYSQYRQWRGTDWVSLDQDGRVVVHGQQRIFGEIVLPEAPSEGLSLGAQVRVTLDPVIHEQATLRVELIGMSEAGREVVLSPRPQGRRTQKGSLPEPWWQEADEVRVRLERRLEEAWNPPVWERFPGPGYLPSARRSATVSAGIRAAVARSPMLVDRSGDPQFDSACLKVVLDLERAGLSEPLATRRTEAAAGGMLRMRIHCDLLKDTPPLQ